MAHDPRALGGGELAGPVVRVRVDDEDLVEQREPLLHLAHGAPHDRPDRLRLVERRQDERDGEALLLLELDEPREVGEFRVVEVGLGEPALDAGGDRPRFLGQAVRRRERLGLLRELLERLAADGLAGLDHDDRGLARVATASGNAPNSVPSESPGTADAPMTTRSARSASRRIACGRSAPRGASARRCRGRVAGRTRPGRAPPGRAPPG